MKKIFLALFLCGLFVVIPSARAHPADTYGHTIQVTLRNDGAQIVWRIKPGPMLVSYIWYEADANGDTLLSADEKTALQKTMFPGGKLSSAVTAQSVAKICGIAGLTRAELVNAKCLMVEETGAGEAYPFSGEKLSPVLTVYTKADLADAEAVLVEGEPPRPGR